MTLSIISGQSNNSREMEAEWEGWCQMYSLNNSCFACHSYQITAGGGGGERKTIYNLSVSRNHNYDDLINTWRGFRQSHRSKFKK